MPKCFSFTLGASGSPIEWVGKVRVVPWLLAIEFGFATMIWDEISVMSFANVGAATEVVSTMYRSDESCRLFSIGFDLALKASADVSLPSRRT